MFSVELAEIAALELTEAHDWYEKRSPGLGGRLLHEFEVILARLRERPLLYRVVEGRTRRAQLRKFPYGVFFVVQGDRVVVTAFFHAKRSPTRRLGSEPSG